jgi:hypothetical protein
MISPRVAWLTTTLTAFGGEAAESNRGGDALSCQMPSTTRSTPVAAPIALFDAAK